MADDNTQVPSTPDTTTDKDSGGVLFPASAAVVGGVAGAVGSAQLLGKVSKEKEEDATKALKEASEKFTPGGEHTGKFTAYVDAKFAERATPLHYNAAFLANLDAEVAKAKPKDMAKLFNAQYEGQIDALNKIGGEDSKTAIEWIKGQQKAITEAAKKFTDTTTSQEAFDGLSGAAKTAWEGKAAANTAVAEKLATLVNKPEVAQSEHIVTRVTSANKEFAAAVDKLPEVAPLKEQLGKIKTTVETAEKELKAVPEGKTLINAANEAERLRYLKDLNEAKGFGAAMKRPLNLIKKGGAGTAAAVIGGTVLLGGLAYAGARALSGSKKSDSYVEQLQTEKAAAAASPASPSV